jgi:ribonuclease BN (tRNA processing enzyme)
MALGVPRVFAQGGRGRGAAAGEPPRGTQLVLLGTQGGPNINAKRTEASSAVVVDGRAYLVDCGYGTLRALVAAGIAYQQLSTVFITHLHDDHIADLAALLTHQWTGSRAEPTDVYGPYGTAAMVTGALAFTKANAEIRSVDEGRTTRPETVFHGHDLAVTAAPAEAFKDGRVTVRSVENAHFPERARQQMPYRSLAYRFDTQTRSIVISGDTAYSKNLIDLAKGVDFFVCEAMDLATNEEMMARAKTDAENGNVNSISRHVAETHSTTVDVGRMAAEAGVKTVVLTHLLPGSNRPGAAEFPDTTYIEDVRKSFSGEVIVGRDQMVL